MTNETERATPMDQKRNLADLILDMRDKLRAMETELADLKTGSGGGCGLPLQVERWTVELSRRSIFR